MTVAKRCTKCGEVKDLVDFNFARHGQSQRRSQCRPCEQPPGQTHKEAAAASVARMSDKEKDYYAGMVLKVVEEVRRSVTGRLPVPPLAPESTSLGYLAPDVRDYVMKRAG